MSKHLHGSICCYCICTASFTQLPARKLQCASRLHTISAKCWFHAQVHELDMALSEVREEAELLRLRLHIARAERDALCATAPADSKSARVPIPARLSAQVRLMLLFHKPVMYQSDMAGKEETAQSDHLPP
jgi:hypothetical protein